MLSSRSFIIFKIIFQSLIHFESFFMKTVGSLSRFFFCIDVQIVLAPVFESSSFYTELLLLHCQRSLGYICVCVYFQVYNSVPLTF